MKRWSQLRGSRLHGSRLHQLHRIHGLCLVLVGASACNSRDEPAPAPEAFNAPLAPDGNGAASAPTAPSSPSDSAPVPSAASPSPTEGIAVAGRADGMPNGAAANAEESTTPETEPMPPASEPPGAVDPGNAGDGDFVIDTFAMQPELSNRGAPMGRSFSFTMDSTTSTIFAGNDPTLQAAKPRLLTRNIAVYVPARYVDGTKAPILVIQDGPGAGQRNGQVDAVNRALDNLTASTDPARKLPAFLSIAVQNGGNDAQGSERGLEYDTLSDRYARFVQLEVLPAVLADPQIRAAYPALAITDDPEGKATLGCSSGGAAAFTMAWFRPDLFRRAITYSGTFVAQQTNGQPEAAEYPLGAWEYHSSKRLIENSAAVLPIRVFLNVNGMDNGYNAPESGYHNWVLANQHMAAAFKAKGYHYRFVTAQGIGHCDARAWQATLADTLVWAWAGYPTN